MQLCCKSKAAVIWLALFGVGCDASTDEPAIQEAATSNAPSPIEYIDCWTDGHKASRSKCGLLTVPASYDDLDGDTRIVAFAVVPALNPVDGEENDPIVFLDGGPGAAGTYAGDYIDGSPGTFMRDDRELVAVDYRATGMSDPYLNCDGPDDADNCRQTLKDSGMADEFRTANYARDTDLLMRSLGYNSYSLYGISYGTRVALTMMRDTPEFISHVVLDGVFPPEVNGFSQGPRSVLAGLNHIAETCETNRDCTEKLGDTLAQIEQLAANWTSVDGGADLLSTVSMFSHYPSAPLLVKELSQMTAEDSAAFIEKLGFGGPPEGEDGEEEGPPEGEEPPERANSFVMTLGTICSEEAAFVDRQPLNETLHGFSEDLVNLARDTSAGAPFKPSEAKEICEFLEVPGAPDIEMAPVVSSINTLLLSGGMDLQTSFEWGELAAESLDNSQHYIFPFAGHGVAVDYPCARSVTSQFIKNPDAAIDTSCADALYDKANALVLETDDLETEIGRLLPKFD